MKSCKLKQKIIQQSLPCDIEINYLRYTLGELTKKKQLNATIATRAEILREQTS